MNRVVIAVLALAWIPGCTGQDIDPTFQKVIAQLETDVKDLARQVESLYEQRCNVTTLASCANSNYEHCRSVFPLPECPGNEGPNDCGDGITCSRFRDYSASAVRLHMDLAPGVSGNPVNKEVIESLCFSQRLDDWFQAKRDNTSQFWDSIGSQPSSMYFGSSTGAFRIYPAQQSMNCEFFDPRLRPWYVAASSGPKNVVMILDISGSMKGKRLDQLKWAAKRVVNTLSASDFVAIVVFSTTAQHIHDDYNRLEMANDRTKANLTALIDALEAGDLTNFEDGFKLAFQLLDESLWLESDSECNTALLFLTDGSATYGANETAVMDLVIRRIENTTKLLQQSPAERSLFLFTFSVAGVEPDVHDFPSELACAVKQGIWSKISEEEEIVHSLSSYYKLFTLGLDQSEFVSWVHPYTYATGGVVGTTVSVPVFNRANDPPIFLGVVGIDFSLTALAKAVGGTLEEIEDTLSENIAYIADLSASTCPNIDLGLCDLESYRRHSGSNCTENCTYLAPVHDLPCVGIDHPEFLWANILNENATYLDYNDRACCRVYESVNATSPTGGDQFCTRADESPILPINVATLPPALINETSEFRSSASFTTEFSLHFVLWTSLLATALSCRS